MYLISLFSWRNFLGFLLVVGDSLAKSDPADAVALGVVFDQNTDEVQNAFKFALVQHNLNDANRRLIDLQAFVDIINTADAFKLARLICNQFGRGVYLMLGAVSPDSFDTLHSYTNTFQMPFLTPWFPEKVIPPTSGLVDHAVSMRPDYHKAVIDTITYYGWKSIIYIYDSHDGLLRLQQLYQTMHPGNSTFYIAHVKRVVNATEVISFLRSLERLDRWSNKYVVLDSTTRHAKDVLITHVRDVQLGRRNYHYFLSGLVMDDRWEKEVTEFGAVNVTGFRIVDFKRKMVQDFITVWNRELKAEAISSQAALMYDSVLVTVDTLIRLQRRKPELFRGPRKIVPNITRAEECIPGKGQSTPFDHGEKISRLLKKTDIEGLTGAIKFDELGHRINFTMQVVEMTVDGNMVQIATWSDLKGFIPAEYKLRPLNYQFNYERNRTYIVTTILKSPYLMDDTSSDANIGSFIGFCKDLADMIAIKLEIKYQFRLVRDGKEGEENPKAVNGWDGMVGEVLRREADMAIAPLTVTLERERVIDFSRPFLTMDYNPIKKPPAKPVEHMFAFLNPLSLELWICITLSLFVVSLVLFLVSRFSPWEWRLITFSDGHASDNSEASNGETTVVNEFSFWNSVWFSLGSFMQQGSEIMPRSASGRIVSTVWWFFTLILVSSYTANLTSFLTIERISEPLQTYGKFTGGCGGSEQFATPTRSSSNNEHKSLISQTDDHYIGEQSWLTTLLNGNMDLPTSDVKKVNKCDTVVTFSSTGTNEFAVAFPRGSSLREGVNLALQSLKNDGELKKLTEKWFAKPECDPNDQVPQGSEISLHQISGLFYILVGGLLTALVVAVFEFCIHGRAEAARANIPLSAAFRAKTRLGANVDRKPAPAVRAPVQEEEERHGWNGGAFPGYYSSAQQIGQEETELHGTFAQV